MTDENPVRRARQALHMTQKELADELYVTPQTVLMLEQGLFNSIPAEISRRLSVDSLSYATWVTRQRLANQRRFDQADPYHGWKAFRLSVHPTFRGFCRQLYFQPSILRDYELHRQRNREILSEALIQAGVSDNSLENLSLLKRDRLKGWGTWISVAQEHAHV